jgi:hypothetical protein
MSKHDNYDYCSACSGNGTLLCCDGCPRSFHFACCDPPIHPDFPPSGNWLCTVCESNPRYDVSREGIFSPLYVILDKQNPVAFSLPEDVREYFEGVKTGEEGEYEAMQNGRKIAAPK